MEIEAQLLDCDYVVLDNTPIVRLFGKTKEGKTVCGFYRGYYPYFYVLPKKTNEDEVIEFIRKNFSSIIKNIIPVEKYKPINYQSKKAEMLKVVLTDPSKVPEVRERIKKEKLADGIYEADILFKYRFMCDMGLSGFKWIKLIGSASKTNTVKTDVCLEVDEIKDFDRTENIKLRYLSVDIETISREGLPDARKDIIGIISLAFEPEFNGMKFMTLVSKRATQKMNSDTKTFQNEKEMLAEFLKVLETYDPDIMIGYNINGFDFPYLLDRLKENRLMQTLGRCNQKPAISRKFGVQFRNSMISRVIVDGYALIKESIQKGNLRLKRLGLGDVSRALLNDEKLDIPHSEIYSHWNGDGQQLSKLVEYARKDADLSLRLVLQNNLLDKFFELSKVSGILLQDCLDGGEAQRVEILLLKEFNKQGYVLPDKPSDDKYSSTDESQELKGALVLDPKTGLHTDPVIYLDFKSMYPSIFIAYNICPTTFVKEDVDVETITTPHGTKFVSSKVKEGILPTILKKLIDERDNVRSESRKTRNQEAKRILEAKQLALKIMTNAFYGYTGYLRARLYIIEIAATITGCGRYLINRTKEVVEKNTPYEVVYGDTDSIMVKINNTDLDDASKIGKNVEALVNTELSGIVQMKIESVFKTILILSKKRYAGLSYEKVDDEWKEKMVMKGIETVRRDWCDAATKTLFEVLNILLKEQNTKKAFAYAKEILLKLEKNEVPIDELVITKSISKSLSSYKGIQPHVELVKKIKKRNGTAPGVGDRVGFVIVKGMQLLSERSEDPDYVKQNNIPIDSKYYIENQILPPLERVFEVIGISKNELMGMGKQTLLKDLFKNNNHASDGVKSEITSFDGFICNSCNKFYRRIPMIGKCSDCQGEILFSHSGEKFKNLVLSVK
ncbi:MAG: hypothetical protein HYW24_01870 [Candidatus Aenigmarchaeota archaeon]|nr:hypothetical protein [Candidatus Aenigmarchaeota archaeon]